MISSALAEIDPINADLNARKGVSLLGAVGSRWRKGLNNFEDLHETALLRWAGNAKYRPAPLAAYADRISASLRHTRAA